MERVFHILGEALENALTPECFLVVSLVDTGDGKMRLGGGPQKTHWKVVRYWFLEVLEGGRGGLFMQLYTRDRTL